MKNSFLIPLFALIASSVFVSGQTISEEQYARMEERMMKNRQVLGLDRMKPGSPGSISLQWPLQASEELEDCGFYYISAYVDHNASANAIQDWNCGSRTYDGHRGTDIVPWPFIWNKMDNDLVEVIAAAPGIILDKEDGNFDRVCNPAGNEQSNYVVIQHEDGSTALYIHLKTGSLTAKTVGESVSTGEYLGIVGSSGVSTGVHLHFEVRSDGTFNSYTDPYFGPCNTGIGSSWWAEQRPYVEPELLKLSLHSFWPYMAACPNTVDTLYESENFASQPGAQAIFHACSKYVTEGDTWNFRIINPDSTDFDSWSYTSLSTRNISTLGWNKTLPTAPGIYTFECDFLSTICRKYFTILPAIFLDETSPSSEILIFTNPGSPGTLSVKINDFNGHYERLELLITNSLGQCIKTSIIHSSSTDIDVNLIRGLYFYTLKYNRKVLKTGSFLAE